MSPGPPWAILDVLYELLNGGVRVTTKTDIPVHLFMRCTTIEPKEHYYNRMRRGVAFDDDKYFCFDVYTDVKQHEDNDTTTHTWIITDWPLGQQRWCYFWGEIEGQVSPSTTAIFTYTPAINIVFLEKYTLSGLIPYPLVLEEQYTIDPFPTLELIFKELYSW